MANNVELQDLRRKRRKRKAVKLCLPHLPREILFIIFGYCDLPSLKALRLTSVGFKLIIDQEGLMWKERPKMVLDDLPSELLLKIFSFLTYGELGVVARVSKRFRDLAYAESLWINAAKMCFATNDVAMHSLTSKFDAISARDRVRIAKNWKDGKFSDTTLLVQSIRYMPRLQLEGSALWVSWGNKIWSHPRNNDGTISRTTNRVLTGHTDDVARFVVKDGLVVSGGRDQSLFGWNALTGEFSFAKRYCHGSEVTAVDITNLGSTVVTGSRDRTVKIWSLIQLDNSANQNFKSNNINANKNLKRRNSSLSTPMPTLAKTVDIGDRIWSLAADPISDVVAVGSAGLCGILSLHMIDLETGTVRLSLGNNLKRGAGMLDVSWLTQSTLLSCGYDSCTRLWDTRTGSCVRAWEEPFNESIYCFATDNNMTLVCGTARHGMVRLWDMRHHEPVGMVFTKHAHLGQSSPVYSVGLDMAYLYIALDQCMSLVSFDPRDQNENLYLMN